MESKRIKKITSFIMKSIGAILSIILFLTVTFKLSANNDNTILRLIFVEYPPLLLGVMFIEFKCIGKTDSDSYLEDMLSGIIGGTLVADIISYVFVIVIVMKHITLYNKIIYLAAIIIPGYILYNFFTKRKLKWIAGIIVLLIFILVPGGIIINESFGEYNVHEYNAVVKECRIIKESKIRKTTKITTYHILFEGTDEEIPIKEYEVKNIREFNSFQEGSIVKMKKYTGVLGLPAIKVLY